jgi:hypothetical protein
VPALPPVLAGLQRELEVTCRVFTELAGELTGHAEPMPSS